MIRRKPSSELTTVYVLARNSYIGPGKKVYAVKEGHNLITRSEYLYKAHIFSTESAAVTLKKKHNLNSSWKIVEIHMTVGNVVS